MNKIIIFFISVVLSGCVTGQKLNDLSPGMKKDDVIKILGTPDKINSSSDQQLLKYWIYDSTDYNSKSWYVVLLKDGKVTKYGEIDDVFPPTEEELAARRARTREMLEIMRMMPPPQISAPTFQPPQQTHCTSTKSGNSTYTDCY